MVLPKINIETNNSPKIVKLDASTKKNTDMVYHLADIHIKNKTEDHEQYREVFKNLLSTIKSDNNVNPVTVVCGDIINDNTWLRPECIELCKEFFITLTSVSDVIVIVGNHDCNMNNSEALDSLRPILTNLNTVNKIFILTENCLYEYNNIIFGVTTVYSSKVTPCKIKSNHIKIALYHGTINGSRVENGSIFEAPILIKTVDFNDYDYVMLGDIHKHQYLNKNRTIAYPSSLIQQNYGEDIENHGFIKWDLVNKKSELVKIKNDYGFVSLSINGNKMSKYNPAIIPKKAKIKIEYTNCTIDMVQSIIETLKLKHPECEITSFSIIANNAINLGIQVDNKKKIDTIKTKNDVINIIKSYCENMKYSNTDTIIEQINKSINKMNYNFDKTVRKVQLEKLEFSNLFCYGENNIINFEKMTGINCIIANNGQGKTSLINTILFSLFGKYQGGETYDAINLNLDESKKAYSRISLSVNDDKFVVERRFINNRSNKKKHKDYEIKVFKNGNLITEYNKEKTNDYINENICNYNDIINTNIVLQKGCNLLDMKDRDLKTYLQRIFDLEIINELHKCIQKKKYDRCANSRNKKKELDKYNIDEINKNIDELSIKIKENEKNIKIHEDKITSEQKQYDVICGKINVLKECCGTYDFASLETDYNKKNNEIKKNNMSIKTLELNMYNLKKELNDSKQKITEYENNGILESYEKFINEKKTEKQELLNKKNEMLRQLIKTYDGSFSKIDLNKLVNQKNKLTNQLVEYNDEYNNVKKYLYSKVDKKELIVLSKHVNKLTNIVDNKKNELLIKKKIVYEEENKMINNNCWVCTMNSLLDSAINNKEYLNIVKTEINFNELLLEKYINEYETKLLAYDGKESANRLMEKINSSKNMLTTINDKINRCMQNIEAEKSNNLVETGIRQVENQLLKNKGKTHDEYNDYLEFKNRANNLDNKIRKLQLEISEKNSSVQIKQKDIALIKTKLDKIRETVGKINLEELSKDAATKKNNLIVLKQKLIKGKTLLDKLKEEYVRKKCEHDMYEKIIKEKIECDKKLETINMINELFNKDSLMNYYLEKCVLDSIIVKTNEILSNFSNLQIHIYLKDGKVIIAKKMDNISLLNRNFCNFEEFMVNFALRLSLSMLNKSQTANFFIVDEGFSVCDDANIENLKKIFLYMKHYYKWSIMVSHNDKIKTQADYSLAINKKGITSYICSK